MALTRPALCLSGSFSVSRSSLKAAAAKGAFGVVPSPSRNCDLLVIGARASRKKICAALERGIPVVGEPTARAVIGGLLPLSEVAKQAAVTTQAPSAKEQSDLLARLDPFLAPLWQRRSESRAWHWELTWLGYEHLLAGQAQAGDFQGLSELVRALEALAARVPTESAERVGEFACLYGPSGEARLLELVEQQLFIEAEQLDALSAQAEDELVNDGALRVAHARKQTTKKFPLLAQAVEAALQTGALLDHEMLFHRGSQLQAPALVGWETRHQLARLIPYSRYKRGY